MVRKGLGMAACRLYALESMIYLTTGLYDEYENPKIFMETAILKVNTDSIIRSSEQI